jgi:hypothetical protein
MYDDGTSGAGLPPNTSAFAFVFSDATHYKSLVLQDFHVGTTYPKTVTFQASDTFAQCDLCVVLSDGCAEGTTSTTCSALYFQQGGQVTVTHADTNVATGTMTASGTNLVLKEWDFQHDAPVANGRCYQVGSVSWNVSWP